MMTINIKKTFLLSIITLPLFACGGGGSSEQPSPEPQPIEEKNTPDEELTTTIPPYQEALDAVASVNPPETLRINEYKQLNESLPLDIDKLDGTWVKLASKRNCSDTFSGKQCSVSFRRLFFIMESSNNVAAYTSCLPREDFVRDSENDLWKHYTFQPNLKEFTVTDSKHMYYYAESRNSDEYPATITEENYFKLSDEKLAIGNLRSTLAYRKDDSTYTSTFDNDCYIEHYEYTYNIRSSEHEELHYHKIYGNNLNYLVLKNTNTETPQYFYSASQKTQSGTGGGTGSIDYSTWTATGSFDVILDNNTTYSQATGTFSIDLSALVTP